MNNKLKRIIAGTLSSAIVLSQTGCSTKNINNNYNNKLDYKKIESYMYNSPLKSIINSSFSDNTKCSYTFDNDYNKLINTIKNNTIEYIRDNKEYTNPFSYSSIDMEEILNQILKELFYNATNNINEDMCSIDKLSIVYTDINKSTNKNKATYIKETKTIVLYLKNLKTESNYYGVLVETEIKQTMEHEINHLRQHACNERQNQNNNIDSTNYLYDYTSFLTEASAESYLYNYYDHFDNLNM